MTSLNYSKYRAGINTAVKAKHVYYAVNTPNELVEKLRVKNPVASYTKLVLTSKELGAKMGKLFPVLFISDA